MGMAQFSAAPVAALIGKMPLEILLDGPVTHVWLEEIVLLLELQMCYFQKSDRKM
jgi:hypothetical protein